MYYCMLPTPLVAALLVGDALASLELSGGSSLSSNTATLEGGAIRANVLGEAVVRGGSRLSDNRCDTCAGGVSTYSGGRHRVHRVCPHVQFH